MDIVYDLAEVDTVLLQNIVFLLRYPPHMYAVARVKACRRDQAGRSEKIGRVLAGRRRVKEEEVVSSVRRRPKPRPVFHFVPRGGGRPPPTYVPCKVRPGPDFPRPSVATFSPRAFERFVAGRVR